MRLRFSALNPTALLIAIAVIILLPAIAGGQWMKIFTSTGRLLWLATG